MLQPLLLSGVGFELVAATNMVFVNKDLGNGMNWLADSFLQIRFADAFFMNVDIAEIEVIHFSFQVSATCLARTQ